MAAMNRKKIDNRIRVLIENGVALRHRSFFVIAGDKGRDQVVILHHILSKATVKTRPSVLWCYKKELGFSSHRKKRMKQLQKKIKSGTLDLKKDDPFELFIAATNIRYCYYAETHKVLGNTYGMCVLQDFEALTPNLLARTIETVEGGGVVVLLLRTMNSLKQLYTMTMDVHSRYRTESHQDVVGRFNERFILSLSSCAKCMVIDDQLNILPISSHVTAITPVPPKTKSESESASEAELRELKESLADTPPVGALVKCARTLDQAKGILKFVEAISEKTLRSTVAMTAARGRGKSAALGLAIAAAVGFGYSNIYVTSPSPENLKTLFEFVFKGFDALEYQEHEDYEIIQSTNPEFNKAVVRVNIYQEHRQTVQYIHPSDCHKLDQAELVVVDEAAAIPLPLVRQLMGPYLVFMASTVNGYEGTGRSLSLKLIEELRKKCTSSGGGTQSEGGSSANAGRVLREVTLNEPIRYAAGDDVEKWLHDLLCLDAATLPRITSGCPLPQDCELYYVNRDTLFSYHKASEEFLHRVMALYVASHYKNTPDDLQLLSDAPAHHLFVLLPPVTKDQTTLPDVLCVLQVCFEGEISKASVMQSLSRGKRASGDLIPWTVSQQFVDHGFASLSGARVVRIATHPDFQKMGYGSRALQLLQDYFEGHITNLSEAEMEVEPVNRVDKVEEGMLLTEVIKPRTSLPPLLCKLCERVPEQLDYLGVSYGLTPELFKFWKRAGFTPVYIRQTPNDLTGEHSCVMLKTLQSSEAEDGQWLQLYCKDFRQRFVSLLSYSFRSFQPGVALSILQTGAKTKREDQGGYSYEDLCRDFSKYDLKRLDLYSRNMADHHLITDLLPLLSSLYFLDKTDFHLSAVQAVRKKAHVAILLGLGLQRKSVEDLQKELDLPSPQVMGLFARVLRKFSQMFEGVETKAVEGRLAAPKKIEMTAVDVELEEELSKAAEEIKAKQKKEVQTLKELDLSQYAIAGKEEEWQDALGSSTLPTIVSISSSSKGAGAKRRTTDTHSAGTMKQKKRGKDGTKPKKKH